MQVQQQARTIEQMQADKENGQRTAN